MSNTTTEERAIPDLPHFYARSDGTVVYKRGGKPTVIKTQNNKDGWRRVGIGNATTKTNASLVNSAFNGPPPSDAHQTYHLDGDHDNDRPHNLAWKTRSEVEHLTRLRALRALDLPATLALFERIIRMLQDAIPLEVIEAETGILEYNINVIRAVCSTSTRGFRKKLRDKAGGKSNENCKDSKHGQNDGTTGRRGGMAPKSLQPTTT